MTGELNNGRIQEGLSFLHNILRRDNLFLLFSDNWEKRLAHQDKLLLGLTSIISI